LSCLIPQSSILESGIDAGVLAMAGAQRAGGLPPFSGAARHPCRVPAAARPSQSDNDVRRHEEGFTALFDGRSTDNWELAGSGHFVVVHDRLESVPGDDLGLFWCTVPTPADFTLRLEWLRWRHEDASGVYLRLPRPAASAGANPALAAVRRGFEVQIDEVGIPGATAIHKTAAIFNEPTQIISPHPAHPAAAWNEFEITVQDQRYTVCLNGRPVTTFVNTDATRGRASTPAAPSFFGLQVQPGSRIAFRNIRIKAL
jgi:hypothetical protein